MQIDRKQWAQWLQQEVTREVFQVLRERRSKLAHALGNGAALGDSDVYAEAVGRYREIDDLLKMDFNDLKEGTDDDREPVYARRKNQDNAGRVQGTD